MNLKSPDDTPKQIQSQIDSQNISQTDSNLDYEPPLLDMLNKLQGKIDNCKKSNQFGKPPYEKIIKQHNSQLIPIDIIIQSIIKVSAVKSQPYVLNFVAPPCMGKSISCRYFSELLKGQNNNTRLTSIQTFQMITKNYQKTLCIKINLKEFIEKNLTPLFLDLTSIKTKKSAYLLLKKEVEKKLARSLYKKLSVFIDIRKFPASLRKNACSYIDIIIELDKLISDRKISNKTNTDHDEITLEDNSGICVFSCLHNKAQSYQFEKLLVLIDEFDAILNKTNKIWSQKMHNKFLENSIRLGKLSSLFKCSTFKAQSTFENIFKHLKARSETTSMKIVLFSIFPMFTKQEELINKGFIISNSFENSFPFLGVHITNLLKKYENNFSIFRKMAIDEEILEKVKVHLLTTTKLEKEDLTPLDQKFLETPENTTTLKEKRKMLEKIKAIYGIQNLFPLEEESLRESPDKYNNISINMKGKATNLKYNNKITDFYINYLDTYSLFCYKEQNLHMNKQAKLYADPTSIKLFTTYSTHINSVNTDILFLMGISFFYDEFIENKFPIFTQDQLNGQMPNQDFVINLKNYTTYKLYRLRIITIIEQRILGPNRLEYCFNIANLEMKNYLKEVKFTIIPTSPYLESDCLSNENFNNVHFYTISWWRKIFFEISRNVKTNFSQVVKESDFKTKLKNILFNILNKENKVKNCKVYDLTEFTKRADPRYLQNKDYVEYREKTNRMITINMEEKMLNEKTSDGNCGNEHYESKIDIFISFPNDSLWIMLELKRGDPLPCCDLRYFLDKKHYEKLIIPKTTEKIYIAANLNFELADDSDKLSFFIGKKLPKLKEDSETSENNVEVLL